MSTSDFKLTFDAVYYHVTDLEKSIAFYRDILGFHLTSRDYVARFDLAGAIFRQARPQFGVREYHVDLLADVVIPFRGGREAFQRIHTSIRVPYARAIGFANPQLRRLWWPKIQLLHSRERTILFAQML